MKRFSTLSIGDPPLGSQADQAILLQGGSLDKGGESYPDDSGDFISGGDTGDRVPPVCLSSRKSSPLHHQK
jgi:hypothetical protein